jgi:ABC-type branched-subunit amino acid transport system substrate-binding protein
MRNITLVVSAMAALTLSCSRLVDTSVVQCVTNADCAHLVSGGAKAVCTPEQICIRGPECSTNAECVVANPAQPGLCRQSDHKCAPLASPECAFKAERTDLTDDNTLWFGIISPRTMAPHMEAAVELVRGEIVKSGNLPAATVTGQRRPIAFVSCTNDNNNFEKSMDHLMNVVQVPAIVGSNASGEVISMLTKFNTQKAGMLTLSPTGSAPGISDIANDGLFYRLSGSNTVAVKGLAYVLKAVVEPQLRSGPNPVLAPGEQMRVAVVHKSDAVGLSDANNAGTLLFFNGKTTIQNGANYKVIDYGDPTDPNNTNPAARYVAAVADVVAFKPHAIFVFASLEFAALDKEIENRWPAIPYRPFWFVVKGIAGIFATDIGSNEDWARRVYGSQPYVDKSTQAYRSFEQSYKALYPDLQVTATATPSYFDTAYLLAYAIAANGARPVTGRNLAEAIRNRLTPTKPPAPPARQFYVGFDSLFPVLKALDMGERIDLQGLTGALDFLPNGDVDQTQEIFCMQTQPDAKGGFGKVIGVKGSGLIFDPAKDTVVGAVTGCPGP